MTTTELRTQLRSLGLLHLHEHIDDVLALAQKRRMTHVQLLEHIALLEQQDRARRGLLRRTQRACLGRFKPMSDFDWNWPTSTDREAVESALRLDFLGSARNIVLVASQGLGKTMIAQNIAHQAVLAGHGVLFVTAAQMLLDLAAQDSARALDRRLKHYARVGCLVLDELGYLSYDSRNADLLYQALSLRYEKKSLVLTTNLAILRMAHHLPQRHLRHRPHRPHRPPRRCHQDRRRQLPPKRGRGGAQAHDAQMIAGPNFSGFTRPPSVEHPGGPWLSDRLD